MLTENFGDALVTVSNLDASYIIKPALTMVNVILMDESIVGTVDVEFIRLEQPGIPLIANVQASLEHLFSVIASEMVLR